MTDLIKDERVFLTPKTKGAPAICYRQPAAVVVANTRGPMVTVLVDGENATREIHVRNLVRRLSASDYPRPAGVGRAPKPLVVPDGMEEVTIW